MKYPKLPRAFYARDDVFLISKELLGKVLVTNRDGQLTAGTIVECEAYAGENDRAAHVFGGRRTKRTETMYGEPGHAYIYLCYGVHHLINIVTNVQDVPNAILIRALEPLEGVEAMVQRRSKEKLDFSLTKGPGSLSQALGISYRQDGEDLTGDKIWIEDRGIIVEDHQIERGPRVGVAYAKEDALLPYRFWVKGNPYVSKASDYSSLNLTESK